jgi:hypothetical protein
MAFVAEAFCIDFVEILRVRGPRREPAAWHDHLEPTERRVVARRVGEVRLNAAPQSRSRLLRVA